MYKIYIGQKVKLVCGTADEALDFLLALSWSDSADPELQEAGADAAIALETLHESGGLLKATAIVEADLIKDPPSSPALKSYKPTGPCLKTPSCPKSPQVASKVVDAIEPRRPPPQPKRPLPRPPDRKSRSWPFPPRINPRPPSSQKRGSPTNFPAAPTASAAHSTPQPVSRGGGTLGIQPAASVPRLRVLLFSPEGRGSGGDRGSGIPRLPDCRLDAATRPESEALGVQHRPAGCVLVEPDRVATSLTTPCGWYSCDSESPGYRPRPLVDGLFACLLLHGRVIPTCAWLVPSIEPVLGKAGAA